jgi:hypothetical protein
LVLPIRREKRVANEPEKNAWHGLIAGMRFVLSRKIISPTITLDLFAVLLWWRDGVE